MNFPKQTTETAAPVVTFHAPVVLMAPTGMATVSRLDVLDAPGNFWDRRSWWQKVLVVCGLIVLCGMVAGILTGIPK